MAVLGFLWPVGDWPRQYLRAGRRLALGSRLAALDVLLRQRASGLLEVLVEEIQGQPWRPWRLLLGRAEAALFGLVLVLAAVGITVPPLAWEGGPLPAPVLQEARWPEPSGPEKTSAPRGELAPPPSPRGPAPLGASPTLGYSPFQDLLAAVLGLDWEELGEDVGERLAAEEGLLRRLADALGRLQTGDLTEAERSEYVQMARSVARPDVRSRLTQAFERGDDRSLQEAQRALAAVLQSREELARGTGEEGGESAPGTAPTAGSSGPSGERNRSPSATPGGSSELMDLEAEGYDEGVGEVAGTGPGSPLTEGVEGEWTSSFEGSGVGAWGSAGEGPVRAYLVPGLPGEPPGRGGEPTAPTPQEVELLLRAREIPPEYRDLVRRYFQLITGGGS